MSLARHALLAFAIALALCPLPVVAQTPVETEDSLEQRLARPDYARGGYFLAVEGLVAVENSALIAPNAFLVSGGFDIRIGARHNRWFATELYGLYVHQYGDGTDRFLAWGMSANERVYFTRSRLQPFVTAGVGLLQLETRGVVVVPSLPFAVTDFDPKFAMLFGTGVEVFINEDFAINLMANYHLPFAGSNEFDFITAGLGFVFF
ncbi:MAG TPA: hypothetical protein VJP77_00320 [Planctomycetota bacterium]|nr:hypothetical protein [Planctomycetota bacterium]